MLQQCKNAGVRGDAQDVPRFRITAVEVNDAHVTIRINDDAAVDWPLRRLPEVGRAQPATRLGWELTDDGIGINWPQLSRRRPNGLVCVWEILEEQLYDEALGRGAGLGWSLAGMARRDAELVALWRLRMDLVFGSYLQFRSSWCETTNRLSKDALARVGASSMARLLEEMDALAERHSLPCGNAGQQHAPIRIPGSDHDRLQDLEEAFWAQAPRLPRLVVETYGSHAHRRRSANTAKCPTNPLTAAS